MNTYIAITTKTDDKYVSWVIRVRDNDNLLSVLNIKDIQHANICSSKKKAYELSDYWNECYKINGTYLYQV